MPIIKTGNCEPKPGYKDWSWLEEPHKQIPSNKAKKKKKESGYVDTYAGGDISRYTRTSYGVIRNY